MLSENRHQLILEHVNENGSATTEELSSLTGASLATIRRDIRALSDGGLLLKVHGGARAALSPMGTPTDPVDYFCREADGDFSDKLALAREAARHVHSQDILFIGAGMTCNLLSQCLSRQSFEQLTIVTTNLTAALELAGKEGIHTLLLGGTIHAGRNHVETLDDYTISTLEKFYFDKAFFTVDGASLSHGYSIKNRSQLPLYDHLLKNTREPYLMVNTNKFDHRAFTAFCDLTKLPYVITNKGLPAEYAAFYEEHNIKVTQV